MGVNMTVPYGAWMGSVIEDSFWAPHDVIIEIQEFLARHEDLFSTDTFSETAVVFSVESSFEYTERHGSGETFPFWGACDSLVRDTQPFDVVMFGDGRLREDPVETRDLRQYRTLVLPECRYLTDSQVQVIKSFLDRGGRVLAIGGIGENLIEADRAALFGHRNFLRGTTLNASDLADGPQVIAYDAPECAINIQRLSEREAAIHIIRYDYDKAVDAVPVLPRLNLEVRLARPFRMVEAVSPVGHVGARLTYSRETREMHRLELTDVPLYTVVLLRG